MLKLNNESKLKRKVKMVRGRPRKDEPKREVVPFSMIQDKVIEGLIEECIKENDIEVGDAKICGLMVTPCISPSVAGRCIRAGKELTHFSGYDYIIEISKEIWDLLSETSRKLLVLHECMHIKVTYKKDGEPIYSTRPHDIEDFSELVQKYGVNWIKEVNLVKEDLADVKSDGGIFNG